MDNPGESVKTVTAMAVRKNFGKLLEVVYYQGDQFVIERAGRPMAALVPLSRLEAIQKPAPSAKSSKRKKKRTG